MYQSSEYTCGATYVRVLNIPFPKYKKVPFSEIQGFFSGFPLPEI